MREQAGDGLDDVAHVFAAAEVADQGPPVFQVGDAVLDADASVRSSTSPSRRAWLVSAQLPGLVGLQKNTRPSPSVTTVVLTAFCLLLPGTNLSRSRRPAGGPGSRCRRNAGLPAGAEVVDDLGQGP
ncbi:hypothetical protein GCM10010266_65390 [Streptomyces griseomycini]|nr:hypothetical protein GCM10010266_65390 [Streptomyces griseomycini]GGR36187.1 hypothetical protein GCM10015536_47490 [Streptomyces griseomycini]